jgi:Spy/CpxP family protein refolding chaperone
MNQRGMVSQRMMGKHMHGRMLNFLTAKKDEFNITEEQIEKIKTLTFEMQENMIEFRNVIEKQRLELRKILFDKENLDYTRIKDLLSKQSEIRNNFFIERLKTREEIDNVLTPEQKEAIKETVGERWGKRNQAFRGRRILQGRGWRNAPRMHRRFRR